MADANHAPDLAGLLVAHRNTLLRIVAHRGGGLRRFESADDLVQGVHLQALRVADRFEWRGDREFIGWLGKLADQHIADRNRYWKAKKRHASRLLRVTKPGGDSQAPGGVEPISPLSGATTFAERREGLLLATQALDLLLPRDQDLVRWIGDDLSIDDIAEQLGITYEAAKRARLRAMDRFRDAYALLSGDS